MPEQKFKRNTAYKLRIGDILIGKPVINEGKFSFLELGDKKINRVNVVGNIVDKYNSDGEKKFIFFTLDDGSGQTRLKAFGEDADKFKDINQGETVVVIGGLRSWNDEVYIQPEIIKQQDPRYLLLRKLEIEKERSENAQGQTKEQGNQEKDESGNEVKPVKDRVMELIKGSEEQGGIETDQIIMQLRDVSPDIINQEIQKMLEEGIVFEPRPGKVRYLG